MSTNRTALHRLLGVKSDPCLYRYSYRWLFELMADEGVQHLQLGTFFELYDLPDAFFTDLRRLAADHGITISSIFTAHRELGGFFREDGPGWENVATKKFHRLIEIAGLLGSEHIGSNPGAVLRDRMDTKSNGLRTYINRFKQLMHHAADSGVKWLTIEPMSCLAEPPTLPREMTEMMAELDAHHGSNLASTARPGFCLDVAHGYADANRAIVFDHFQLMHAALPWTCEIHLKNTDATYDSTFGFTETERARGIIDAAAVRDFYTQHADQLPVKELVGYLEIGGPKLGRDYSDPNLGPQLRQSLQHLKSTWLEDAASTPQQSSGPVQIAPSMMCVDPLNLQAAVRQLEFLGVDWLHIDIMDARFAPNMPMGLGLIEPMCKRTRLPLDVHLMVQDNEFFVAALAGMGVKQISVHAESSTHLDRVLGKIRDGGARAGVAINPATSLEVLDYVVERIDYVLLMTVNPGFAGQKLTPASIRKIADCRARLDRLGHPNVSIQVDGNVSFANIAPMVAAGADCLVAGTSSIFSTQATWSANLQEMRQAITTGLASRKLPVASG
jgi:ribulose-phosphate 3-epimerase